MNYSSRLSLLRFLIVIGLAFFPLASHGLGNVFQAESKSFVKSIIHFDYCIAHKIIFILVFT